MVGMDRDSLGFCQGAILMIVYTLNLFVKCWILYLIFVGLSSPTRYNHVPMVTQAAPTLQLQPQLIAQVSCPVAIFFLL